MLLFCINSFIYKKYPNKQRHPLQSVHMKRTPFPFPLCSSPSQRPLKTSQNASWWFTCSRFPLFLSHTHTYTHTYTRTYTLWPLTSDQTQWCPVRGHKQHNTPTLSAQARGKNVCTWAPKCSAGCRQVKRGWCELLSQGFIILTGNQQEPTPLSSQHRGGQPRINMDGWMTDWLNEWMSECTNSSVQTSDLLLRPLWSIQKLSIITNLLKHWEHWISSFTLKGLINTGSVGDQMKMFDVFFDTAAILPL